MASPSDGSSDQVKQNCNFKEWMELQGQDLSELLEALDKFRATSGECPDHAELRQLVEKNIEHFQDYTNKRRQLARSDVTAFLSPEWCTSLEASMLWISGCRPSIFIRLIYALSVQNFEARLQHRLHGIGTSTESSFGDLSADQMNFIDSLHRRTIKEEEKLSTRLASLQEEIADEPIALLAKELDSTLLGQENAEVKEALYKHEKSLMSIFEEADKLRLDTLKELTRTLATVQAVDFLAASKKLHFCIRAWGSKRDNQHGRNR